jgi:hypothetical protein
VRDACAINVGGGDALGHVVFLHGNFDVQRLWVLQNTLFADKRDSFDNVYASDGDVDEALQYIQLVQAHHNTDVCGNSAQLARKTPLGHKRQVTLDLEVEY